MDPNAALATIREQINGINRVETEDPLRLPLLDYSVLVETVAALDEWLTSGGFPPDDWALHRSEVQWRVFCKDCAEVIECSEDLGRRIVHAEVEAKTQHRYFLQRRTHAFSEWENVDAS